MVDHRYGIGLDIGISSVGYAVVLLNEGNEPCGIVCMGSRIFPCAEVPKTGASLAEPRRLSRSERRRNRRRRHRKERIRALLVRENVIDAAAMERLYATAEDVYALRARGLEYPLTPAQFCKVLIHLAQRRGFKSNRKADKGDAENGKLLSAVDENRRRMQENQYRTVGEMFFLDAFYAGHKRNKAGDYLSTVSRDMVEDETRQLFAAQKRLGQPFATDRLLEQYCGILLAQRSFDEGPGGDSPYGGSQIEKMRGECTFIKGEKRAPKAAYSFELFRLLTRLNHTRILSNGDARALTAGEREAVIAKAHQKERITYKDVRSALKATMRKDDVFVGLRYEKEAKKDPEAARFESMSAYFSLRKALDSIQKDYIKSIPAEKLDAIAEILTCYKQGNTIREKLAALPCTGPEIEALESVPAFSGFGHVCLRVCRELIPHLKTGVTYDEACALAGYDHRAHQKNPQYTLPYLPDAMNEITSPVVLRAVSQTIKVVNAIIRKMGASPSFVHVELAREMAKTHDERKEMTASLKENEQRNEQIVQQLKELGVSSPSGMDIVKLKLYHQQGGRCAYSLQSFDIRRLFEPGYAEIDHIIPYSLSFDDSYNNKALIFSKENREKGNRLPLQYLTGDAKDRFIVHTQNAAYPYKKRLNLLKKGLTEEDRQRFKERNLQDTKHLSRFMYNYINDYLLFVPSEKKKRVMAVNGGITAHLRKRWGLTKVRGEGDQHHALDAVVIACATDGMIAKISRYYDRIETGEFEMMKAGDSSISKKTSEIFPLPWPGFHQDVVFRMGHDPAERLRSLRQRGMLPSYDGFEAWIDRAAPIFVSRMPNRKVKGQAHLDTIKRIEAEGMTVKRVPIEALKLENGEIKGYYRPQDDRTLYEALKARLTAYGGDGKKAFQEPVFKPAQPGHTAPQVRKVKIYEKNTVTVPVHQGKGGANNGKMVRIDLFFVPGEGYYLIPIYVSDTIQKELPMLACVGGKPYSEWKPVLPEHFLFSVYPNDLLVVESKKEISMDVTQKDTALPPKRPLQREEPVYFISADISVATIRCESHDGAYYLRTGIKTLKGIRKMQVDVLGTVSAVKKEERQAFR